MELFALTKFKTDIEGRQKRLSWMLYCAQVDRERLEIRI